jgi:small basic protein
MPSVFFAKHGISQTTAYGLHMFMYGTPVLLVIKNFILETIPGHFEKYIFSDWPFLTSLTIIVFFDTITGGIAAMLNRRWNPEKNKVTSEFSGILLYQKLGKKTLGIALYVMAIGVIKKTVIDGEENLMTDIVDAGFYSVMIGFEGASVLRNIYKIYPFDWIKLALAKLEVFYDKRRDKVKTEDEDLKS